MKIKSISGALALTMAVSALPAMALNTRGQAYNYNDNNVYGTQNQEKRFKGMDRDGNGVITRDEWRGNDNSFRKHDRNGDGVLSASDRQYAKQGKAKKAKKQHRQNDRDND